MSGLALDFKERGMHLDTGREVDGLLAVVQSALLNLACNRGSDRTAPDRGTELLLQAGRDGVWDPNQAQHLANFAAVDTLFFLRDAEPVTDSDSLADLRLTPSGLGGQRMDLDLYCESVSGQSLGTVSTFINGASS